MRTRSTRSTNLDSLSWGGWWQTSQTRGHDDCGEDEDKKSSSEADKQKEEDVAEMMPLVRHALGAPRLPPTVIKEMKEMFLRLWSSQIVAIKLVYGQGIDSPWTLASLSDEDIIAVCNVIHRPGGLVSGKTLDKGNQISILAMKNLKLTAIIFKIMEHCSKDYSTSVAVPVSMGARIEKDRQGWGAQSW